MYSDCITKTGKKGGGLKKYQRDKVRERERVSEKERDRGIEGGRGRE